MEIEHIIKKQQLEIAGSIRDSADLGDGEKEAANLFGFYGRMDFSGREWSC